QRAGVTEAARVLVGVTGRAARRGGAVGEQVAGQPGTRLRTRAQPPHVRRRDHDPGEHVQAVHGDRHPRGEQDRRRLGVVPDVELGDRGGVPGARRAAHEHDPPDVAGDLGVGAPRTALAPRSRKSAAGATARVTTSGPYMVIGAPAVCRIAAASGSCQTLNSATGEAFPAPAAPPMNTIRPMLRVTSGWVRSSRAMLVSGAVGTRVTGRGEARISRRSRVTASTSAGVRRGAGRPRSPIPSWPWTWRAERGASIRGRSAPRATGTSP